MGELAGARGGQTGGSVVAVWMGEVVGTRGESVGRSVASWV